MGGIWQTMSPGSILYTAPFLLLRLHIRHPGISSIILQSRDKENWEKNVRKYLRFLLSGIYILLSDSTKIRQYLTLRAPGKFNSFDKIITILSVYHLNITTKIQISVPTEKILYDSKFGLTTAYYSHLLLIPFQAYYDHQKGNNNGACFLTAYECAIARKGYSGAF